MTTNNKETVIKEWLGKAKYQYVNDDFGLDEVTLDGQFDLEGLQTMIITQLQKEVEGIAFGVDQQNRRWVELPDLLAILDKYRS